MLRVLLVLVLNVFSTLVFAQQLFSEGVDYQRIDPPRGSGGKQIEVIEFFRYDCPGCNAFEPQLLAWEKNRKPADVKLTLIPTIFAASQTVLAKAYYAAEAVGGLDVAHAAIFNGIHSQKLPHESDTQLADIVSAKGVDRAKFLDMMSSFDVDAKARRAKQAVRYYQIPSVPAIAVNGRYLVTGSMAGNFTRMLDVMDYLIGLEKKRIKE